jgi:hypothetical protein
VSSKASKLTVVGYSFRDHHINVYISQWINSSQDHVIRIINGPGFESSPTSYVRQLLSLHRRFPHQVQIVAQKAPEGLQEIYGSYSGSFERIVQTATNGHPCSSQPILAPTVGKLGPSLPQRRSLTAAPAKGAQAASEARRRQARDAYNHLIPVMLELQAAGRSLRQIAEALNAQDHKTRRGKSWSKTQVKRVLDRIRPA